MKIDDIDAFVEVIRCQSISHAAESLQLTQPAITRRVQNFEQALGVELFDRNTKPLKPTLIGTRVYEQCRLILREMDALRELVATDAPPTGLLRLGVPQTIGDVVLLDALKHLRVEYPELRTQVATGWGSQLVGKIERGELDAAAALFPAGKIFPDNIIGESIGKMELVVVCARTKCPSARANLPTSTRVAGFSTPMAVVSAPGCNGPCRIRAWRCGSTWKPSALSCNWAWLPTAWASDWCRARCWSAVRISSSWRWCRSRTSNR